MKRRWRNLRCRMQGHSILGRLVTDEDGTSEAWCRCGKPYRPPFYTDEQGRMWLHGRGPS